MNRREFELIDDKSKKFWSVEWEHTSLTVRFGRIGTSGQAQQKSFASEEALTKERDKLILEKTKKGYKEVDAARPTAAPAVPSVRKSPAAPSAVEAQADPTDRPTAGESPAAAPSHPTPPGLLARSIALAPIDRFVVTWEAHEPLPKPPPPPFDLEDALRRLRSVGSHDYAWQNDWRKASIPLFPSRTEAHFWMLVCQRIQARGVNPQQVADELTGMDFDGEMAVTQISEACATPWPFVAEHFFGCVTTLVPFDELLAVYQAGVLPSQGASHWSRSSVAFQLTEGFRNCVHPYLNAAERERIRAMVAGNLAPMMPASFYETWPAPYRVAALLGFPEEIAAVLRGVPDNHYKADPKSTGWSDYHQRPQWLVFGLGNPASVRTEFRRLGLILRNQAQGRAWLALTGCDALEVLADSICAEDSKERAADLARTLRLVAAPEGAVPALRLVLDSKVPQAGQEWLAGQPLHAVVGLTPAAMGAGKLAEAARKHLLAMRRDNQRMVLAAALPHLTPEQGAWLQHEVIDAVEINVPECPRAELPEPLRAALAAAKPGKPPGWLTAGSLPPIMIQGKKLGLAEVATLLTELKNVPVGQPSALISALKEQAEPHALDTFAWDLFERWESMGAPSKDRWALGAVGHLGGDNSVLKLTPRVRQWPGESQHQRAVFGLECLRAVGSDTALMALNGIAQKLKFKALKDRAQTLMEGIAQARGLTREQLADRIVPDCDLDERGSRVFDFGPRQFRFVLGPEMKPLVRDAAGKVRPDLPPPNSSDDPEKTGAAVAAWKLLKKTLREVLKVQAERLEDAMITGRRWTPEEFQSLLVRQPLMVNLARQLVFATYDDAGRITRTFRITEDQTFADQDDEETSLSPDGSVGVVHPAQLDEGARNAWGQVLSDYEIIPPFQQMGRAIIRPEPEDLEAAAITRYKGPKVPGIVMYGMLERNHWLRDTPADAGGFVQHSKHFPSANLTAFIQYTGMGIGYYDEPQELESVYFVPGKVDPAMWGDHKTRLKIKEVDSVVLSEVLRLANAIVSKAE